MRRLLLVSPALLLAACSAPRQEMFSISAIDTEEKPLTCVVLQEDSLLLDAANEPVRTPATVKVTFKRGPSGDYDSVKLGVRAVQVGPDGKITRGTREGEESPYREDWRGVYPTDSKRQLFVLLKNKSFGG